MTVKDLKKVADKIGLFNDLCGEREAKLAFNLAKSPIIDEVSSDATLKINYVESSSPRKCEVERENWLSRDYTFHEARKDQRGNVSRV